MLKPDPSASRRASAPRKPTTKPAASGLARATTGGAINIRVRDDDRTLIDQAALLSGKSRSEFMLDAARRAASEAILNRTLFRMAPAAFARFTAMLDAPPQPNAKLRRLMQAKAPWE
jgi:uncharacterized protein (DUF1778 family)